MRSDAIVVAPSLRDRLPCAPACALLLFLSCNAYADTVVPVFSPQQSLAMGTHPYSVVTVDLNGDGRADVVDANYLDNTVAARLNTTVPGAAAASFAGPDAFGTGWGPQCVVAGDIDGDGKADLVVANYAASTISVLRNLTASGAAAPSFAPAATFSVGTYPASVAVADVNADGKLDLIAANSNDGSGIPGWISVLLNASPTGGTLDFPSEQTFAAGVSTDAVAAADINGDGRPDVIATNFGDNSISVLLDTTATNAMTATFAATQTFATGSHPYSGKTADFNGDGRPDVVVSDSSDNAVSVLLNQTAPNASIAALAAQQPFATGAHASSVSGADIDGDGRPDLIATNLLADTISVRINTTATGAGVPSFAAPHAFATDSYPQQTATADFNGDGRIDVVVSNFFGNSVSVLLNGTPRDSFVGYLMPILDDGAAWFRSGRTIPVKFTLNAPDGSTIANAVAHIQVFRVLTTPTGTVDETANAVPAGASNTGTLFRFDGGSGQYIYNLSTMGYAPGTYLLRTSVDDGITHDQLVSIR